LDIKESTDGDWRPKLVKKCRYALPLTDVPLPIPGNIKNFKEIGLKFVFLAKTIFNIKFPHLPSAILPIKIPLLTSCKNSSAIPF
jgi:hypothetical protein